MDPAEDIKPTEIFSGTAWQADTVKGMLMDNEIQAYLGDEIWGVNAETENAPAIAGAVKVFVSRNDFEDARIVVERYYEEDLPDDYQ